jgi:hypothetical protein
MSGRGPGVPAPSELIESKRLRQETIRVIDLKLRKTKVFDTRTGQIREVPLDGSDA